MSRPVWRDVLALGVAMAILVGAIHVVVIEVQLHLLHRLTWTSREFVWMAPLAYAICFLALALPIATAGALWPRLVSFPVAAMPLVAFGALSLILLVHSIHPIAQVLLALGVGVQGAHLLGARRHQAMAVARRVMVWGAAGVLVAGVAAAGWRTAAERFAMARRAPPAEDLPNVLLIILDTVRPSSMSLYGYGRSTTPVLERLAGESAVFDYAFATAPWSLPSHASLFTGLWPSQTKGDLRSPIDGRVATLAGRMRDRGYATGGFSANLGYVSHETGLQRGFTHFEDFPVDLYQLILSTTLLQTESGQQIIAAFRERDPWRLGAAVMHPHLRIIGTHMTEHPAAGDVAGRFFRWRDGLDHRPYYAMLNFMDAHNPYRPPGDFGTKFNAGRNDSDKYAGSVAYLDSIVGSIVDGLKHRGELDRTILVVTSDHGELFGEHARHGHGGSMYYPLVHVPLLIRAPGRAPAGVRIQRLVSLRDIPATLLELTGDSTGSLPGWSLSRAARGGESMPTSPILLEDFPGASGEADDLFLKGAMRGWIDNTWHYVRYRDGREVLFAWRSDPEEAIDRSGSPDGRVAIANIRRRISETRAARVP